MLSKEYDGGPLVKVDQSNQSKLHQIVGVATSLGSFFDETMVRLSGASTS